LEKSIDYGLKHKTKRLKIMEKDSKSWKRTQNHGKRLKIMEKDSKSWKKTQNHGKGLKILQMG